ncbi:uncharacterized protein LOC117111676 [Anneissia japonica]|uniref:uncharacterized protein LOC117111676 n=1 Tax=Anneissia japonica TaxID=1529436 RepID=UPI001425A436|nr:uncharacterized protein LOC117111676 [Anneissia japonica]
MSNLLCNYHHYLIGGALLASSSIAAYSTYKLLRLQKSKEVKKKDATDYESEKVLSEYLVFHFGAPHEVLRYSYGPKDSLDFPRRLADECLRVFSTLNKDMVPSRALDIGCAVGRTSFELTKGFDEVIGIDYSEAFVDACNILKANGSIKYSVQDEWQLTTPLTAVVDTNIDRNKASFQQGDACNLPLDLGQFGCVVAANLICRLHTPMDFLNRLSSLVAPGGFLLLTSPFTFSVEYTPKKNMLGGYKDKDGNPVWASNTLQKVLELDFELLESKEMPFFIRETAHKNQWTVAYAMIWKRKE